MKIAVIGATGPTGQLFVQQALAKGHHVTALVRSPEKLGLTDPKLTLVVGNVYQTEDVAKTVIGQDAVFIALGTGKKASQSSIRADGTRQVVQTLAAAGEKPKLVVLSSLGVGESKKQYAFFWNGLLWFMLRHAFRDHTHQEAVVRASGLRWAILRPTFMNDKAGQGSPKATPAPQSVKIRASVPRADVAAYALRVIEQPDGLPQVVALTAS